MLGDRAALTAAVCVVVFALPGCGSPPEPQPLCEVAGTVRVNGAPAGGVYVYFYPASGDDAPGVGVKTQVDGTFAMSFPNPGDYAVTLVWPRVATIQGEEIEGDDQFKDRYRDRTKPVLKVTVRQGQNTIPPIAVKGP